MTRHSPIPTDHRTPRGRLGVAVLGAALLLAPAAFGADDPTGSKAFDFEVGGRIMIDWLYGSADEEAGPVGDGVEFRRARVYWSGKVWDRVKFKAQFDFAQGDPEFKDVYIELDKVPGVGSIRVGHFLEPFSLEQLTSSRYITFAERSLPFNFAPARNTGVMIGDTAADDRVQWAAGIFRDVNNFGDNQDEFGNLTGDDFNITGRITGLPVWLDRGRKMVHLGLNYQHQDRDDSSPRFRARPEAHLAPRLINTGSLDADTVRLVQLEAAFVHNNFSAQSEYLIIEPDLATGSDPTFSSYYVMASWFPTGEHRRYSQSKGAFARVRPSANFLDGTGEGLGAWELKARYSSADLDDAGINGGQLDTFTVGVNWYLNPRTRVMLDYVDGDADSRGSTEWAVLRFQVDF